MASLVENLINVLQQEEKEYEKLLNVSIQKPPVIVRADLEALQKITDEEQSIIDKITHYDSQRMEYMKDIAYVINMDVKTLTLSTLIDLLAGRVKEHTELAGAFDSLRSIVIRVRDVNTKNQNLLQDSMDMVDFEMNLLQSASQAPETANYNKNAYNSGDTIAEESGRFDAKQ